MTLHIIGGVVYFYGQSDQTTTEVEMANIKPIKIVKNNDHTHADSLRVYHLLSRWKIIKLLKDLTIPSPTTMITSRPTG